MTLDTLETVEAPVLDAVTLKKDFPILAQQVHGHELVYLDNAATTQKPQCVIDAIERYYEQDNANVHRGVHELSERATLAYEQARVAVQTHLNASSPKEIVFTKGTTEAINLVSHAFGHAFIGEGDEILISQLEHHSNIVPWQLLAERVGARLRCIPINQQGVIDLNAYKDLLSDKTKLVAIAAISNAIGVITPLKEMIDMAHEQNVPVLVDAAQALPHQAIDVQALDCDFLAFSGHKVYGPTGIGTLYAKEHWLKQMQPYQGGGEMILKVSLEQTIYNDIPNKFEAGTPNIAGAVGLAAALNYVDNIGLDRIAAYEQQLLDYANKQLRQIPGLTIIGDAPHKASVISFMIEGLHPHDLGTLLNNEGVAIRTGHHCAMPLMDYFEVPATARASFAFYNTFDDIDRLVKALNNARSLFQL